MAKLFVPLIKRNISTTFETFLENWIFDGKSTGATLQNSENFVLSQNGVRKYFLAKLFVPLRSKEKFLFDGTFGAVFGKLNFWDTFWKIEILTGASLTK